MACIMKESQEAIIQSPATVVAAAEAAGETAGADRRGENFRRPGEGIDSTIQAESFDPARLHNELHNILKTPYFIVHIRSMILSPH